MNNPGHISILPDNPFLLLLLLLVPPGQRNFSYASTEVDAHLHDTLSLGFRERLPTQTPSMLPVADILEDLHGYIIDTVIPPLASYLI